MTTAVRTGLPRDAFVAIQKIRHEVAEASAVQRTISPHITLHQARALLRWIDGAQGAAPRRVCAAHDVYLSGDDQCPVCFAQGGR